MKPSANTMTMDRHDGCAEFDERLLESAFAPTLDAELDRHLTRCARCTRARDLYMTTADALSMALSSGDVASAERGSIDERARLAVDEIGRQHSIDRMHADPIERVHTAERVHVHAGERMDASASDTMPAHPNERPLWKTLAYALAAAGLLIGVVWLARPNSGRRADLAIVSAGQDARVELAAPGRAIVHEGTAEFEVGDEEALIETPLGKLRTKNARLRISTVLRKESAEMNKTQAAFLVTVAVASGIAYWSSKSERDVEIAAGETLVRPEESKPTDEKRAHSGLVPAIEPGLAQTESRASIPIEPVELFRVSGRTIDASTRAPLAACDVHFAVRWDGKVPLEGRGRSAEDGTFSVSVREVESDRQALAEFAVLVSGAPEVLIEHEGFVPYRDTIEARGGTLPVIDGSSPLALGDLPLRSGARITGLVLSEDGQPVANAAILIGDVMTGLAHPLAFARAIGTTDARGRILAAELVPPLPSSARLNYALTAICAQGVGSTAFTILDVKHAPPEIEIRFGPQCTLDVVVRDPAGLALSDVEVKIVPRFLPYAEPFFTANPGAALGRDSRVLALFASRTDAQGTAHFDHLPMDGDRTVYDVAARHTALGSKDAEVRWKPSEKHAEVALRFTSHRGCSVSGRVVDVRGLPVAGAEVKEQRKDGRRAETDSDGRYRLPDLDPSPASRSIAVEVAGFPKMIRPVELSSEHDLESVDFVCKPAVPIEGRVVDQLGVPVVGAEVYVWEETLIAGSPRSLGKRVTGAEGGFAYADATEGNWRISVQAPKPVVGWWPFIERVVHGGDRAVECLLERIPGSMSRMIAEIVDEETLAPLEPLQVLLRPPHSSAHPSWFSPSISRQPGRVTCDAVPGGDWALWVLVRDHASACAEFKSGEQDEVRLTVRVGRLGKVVGRVVFPPDRHEAGLTLQAAFHSRTGSNSPPNSGEWLSGGLGYCFVPLPADGSFQFDNLVPGRWVLQFSGKDQVNEVSVDVPAGGTAQLEIPALIGAHIIVHARASDPDGRVETNLYRSEDGFNPRGCYLYARKGLPTECDLTVLPDTTYRWEARFYDASQYDPNQYRDEAREPCRRQSGEVRVKAGETVVIDVPSVVK